MIPAGGVPMIHTYMWLSINLVHSKFVFKIYGYNDLLHTAVECPFLLFFSMQRLLCVFMLALLCFYVARCALRSRQWQSEQSLFTSALSVCPLNAKVKCSLWICLILDVIFLWNKLQPNILLLLMYWWLTPQVHYNVGKNLADRGNTTAAIGYYREAVR